MAGYESSSKVSESTLSTWKRRLSRYQGRLLILPPVLVFIFLSVVPISYGIWISLHTGFVYDLEFVGLANYRELIFSDSQFRSSVYTGIYYSVYSVTTQIITGIAIALVINQKMKFGNIIRGIVLLPYMVPTVAIAYVFTWFLNSNYGLINYYLVSLGIIDEGINFFSVEWAMHTVVWVSNWKWSIFVVLLVLARLQSIDEKYYELAKMNGASKIGEFIDVTLPNIKNIVFLVILLRGIWMFNKFDMIYLLTGGGPFEETTTMSIYAYRTGLQALNYGEGVAVTTIMFLMLSIAGITYFYVFSPEEEVDA